MPRLTRRAVVRLLGASTLAAGLALVTRNLTGERSGRSFLGVRAARAEDGATGLIAIPRGREVVVVQADGSGERAVVSLPPGEFVADVALSPDVTLVAFGRFNTPAGGGPGGSDVMVAPVDGSAPPRLIAERDAGVTLLAAPYFMPDGGAVLFEVVGVTGAGLPTVRSDVVGVDGSGRRPLVEDARFPAVSADGRMLVYVKSTMNGDAVWVRPFDAGTGHQVLSERDLIIVSFPRIHPDGTTVLLAGVGDSARSPRKLLIDAPPRSIAPDSNPPLRQRAPSDAERLAAVAGHGLPVDPWLVDVNGSNLHRLALMSVDDAAVAWSPDGRWAAVAGANGVVLVSATDGTRTVVSEGTSFGSIDWR